MSVTTTSGESSSTRLMSSASSRRGADDFEVVLAIHQLMYALAEQDVVLGEDDPNLHGVILLVNGGP